jgi:phage protein U
MLFGAEIAFARKSIKKPTYEANPLLTEKGRASRIGFELDCKRCDEELAQESQP